METRRERERARVVGPMADNIKDLIDSFPNDNEKVNLLNSLKLTIARCSREKLQDDLAHVDLQKFFATFPTLNEEEMGLCCEVIDSLFVAFEHEVVIKNYSPELRQGLKVDHPSVRLICLAELKRIPLPLYERFMFEDDSAISSMIHLITCEPLQVGLSAVSALSRIGECKNGTALLIENHLEELENAMTKGDVIRFRFYEMVMNVASTAAENLPVVVESGLVHKLLRELFEENKPDILAQMNCLELLTNLAQTNFGFRWLSDEGILARIELLLSTITSDSILAILLPGLIAFFGCVAKSRPDVICTQYKLFMRSLFSSTESKDMTLKGIAMETIAHIGSTVEGKKTLQKHAELDEFIRAIGRTLNERGAEMRGRALTATYHLVLLKPKDHTPELLSLTEHWFQLLGDDAFKIAYKYCREPFESFRLAAQNVLLALAYQPWGQKLLCDCPTFKEYLLNRKMESEQEWKYSKFKIVEALLECSFTEEYFGSEYHKQLVDHRNAGPNYVESVSEVAQEAS